MGTHPVEDPLRRLERVLAEDTARLTETRERLADIGDALVQLRARMHHIDLGDDLGVQVLEQEVASPIIVRLAGSADQVDNVVMQVDVGAGAEDVNSRSELERAQEGQRQRTLVHPMALEDEVSRLRLSAKREVGQEQRVSDVPGTEFLVLGDEAVVTLERWGDPTSRYLFVRHPALVRSFATWFDAVWAVSPEVSLSVSGPDEAPLVRLLALGLKDETIARTLGVSLRTVRRRIAGLMDEHGVSTRFQLGVALERDGQL